MGFDWNYLETFYLDGHNLGTIKPRYKKSLKKCIYPFSLRYVYNHDRPHTPNRRGYFWGGRFKIVIVEKGETLINCLAYIDLNPLRAGLVDHPK